MVTLLHTCGDRDNIRDWRAITFLNMYCKKKFQTIGQWDQPDFKKN